MQRNPSLGVFVRRGRRERQRGIIQGHHAAARLMQRDEVNVERGLDFLFFSDVTYASLLTLNHCGGRGAFVKSARNDDLRVNVSAARDRKVLNAQALICGANVLQ